MVTGGGTNLLLEAGMTGVAHLMTGLADTMGSAALGAGPLLTGTTITGRGRI
jgi:hypothetical protein